jgi:hypothetical protein
MEIASLALTIAGFTIALGAVTVIDVHGFLGRNSAYWTEATTRAHKVTKPLIWIGTLLYAAGLWAGEATTLQWAGLAVLVANGLFLTFAVSPFLLRREREGRASELLPSSWQGGITVSFLVSVVTWWGSLALFVIDLAERLQ